VNKVTHVFHWLKNNYPCWVIWIGPIILIGSLILTGKVIFWGTAYLQFLPWRAAGWEQISGGFVPLWNSYNGYGTPLLANYQSAFFYPPNILVWIFAYLNGNQGIALAQTILILLHLVMAGYGMVYLTKELGFSKLGQAVSAIAYSMSGYLISRVSFISVNSVLTWIPWILFTGLQLAKLTNIKSALNNKHFLLSIFFHVLLLLAGHAQIAWYTLVFSFFWMFIWSWHFHRWSKIGVTLGILAILIGFSVGLSAIQLIPTGEFLLQSQRASKVDYAYALNYSFWPWRFLTLISANLFGNPAHGNYWVTADNFWEDNIYTGVLSIVFAFTAISRLVIRHYKNSSTSKIVALFSISAILLSVIFALGKYTPVFPFFYKYIPTFDMFQAPTRFNIWLVLAVSLLAGMGINSWRAPEGKWLYWSRLLAAGAIGIAITSITASYILKSSFQETFISGIAETGILLSILLLINLFAPRSGKNPVLSSPVMTLMVLFFLIGDLVYSNWGVNPGIKINSFTTGKGSTYATSQTETLRLIYIDNSTEQKLKFEKYFRFDSFLNSEGWVGLTKYLIPNSNILNGLSVLNNFDPFITARYENLTKIIIPKITVEDSEFNRFWAIGDVISSVQPPNIETIKKLDDTFRIRWFNCAIPSQGMHQSGELLNNIIQKKTLGETVVIEGIIKVNNICNGNNEKLKIIDYWSNPASIKLNVVAPSDGWLLQLSTNYPGWKTKIDGIEERIYYGDILFRAIKLTKGSHMVEFYYQPSSFILGLSITFCFLCIIFIYIILKRRKIKENIPA
jgi:uncharacterized membrane protein YfhO